MYKPWRFNRFVFVGIPTGAGESAGDGRCDEGGIDVGPGAERTDRRAVQPVGPSQPTVWTQGKQTSWC